MCFIKVRPRLCGGLGVGLQANHAEGRKLRFEKRARSSRIAPDIQGQARWLSQEIEQARRWNVRFAVRFALGVGLAEGFPHVRGSHVQSVRDSVDAGE